MLTVSAVWNETCSLKWVRGHVLRWCCAFCGKVLNRTSINWNKLTYGHILPHHVDAHLAGISEVHRSASVVWQSRHLHLLKRSEFVCVSRVDQKRTRLRVWCGCSFLSCSCHFLSNKLSQRLICPAGTVRTCVGRSRIDKMRVSMWVYVKLTHFFVFVWAQFTNDMQKPQNLKVIWLMSTGIHHRL